MKVGNKESVGGAVSRFIKSSITKTRRGERTKLDLVEISFSRVFVIAR